MKSKIIFLLSVFLILFIYLQAPGQFITKYYAGSDSTNNVVDTLCRVAISDTATSLTPAGYGVFINFVEIEFRLSADTDTLFFSTAANFPATKTYRIILDDDESHTVNFGKWNVKQIPNFYIKSNSAPDIIYYEWKIVGD